MAIDKSCVFITGATGLLGKMYVRGFLSKGYKVIFTSSRQDNINKLYEEFADDFQKNNLQGCLVNLQSDKYIYKIREFIEENKLKPNYLINNARSNEFIAIEDFRKIEKEKWLGEFYLDVVVPYELSICFSQMNNNELKSIINISSMYGILAYNSNLCADSNQVAINYGVAKAALNQLTKELAVRMASEKIRVNSISYGGVEGRADEAFKKRYANLCPMGEMLSQDDIFGHIYYLCSEMSLGMTGHNLVVDGGFSAW